MRPVPPKNSSKLLEGLSEHIQKSSRPKSKVTNYRLRSQGWRPSLQKTQADDCKTGSDQDSKSDIISISEEEKDGRPLLSTPSSEVEGVERSRSPVESADSEVDGSNEACWSECSSVASGPSSRHYAALKEPAPSPAVCSICHKLYQKARRMRAPIKDKLLEKDPNSLSCDQWILLKKIKPKKLSAAKTIESLRLEQRERGERQRESSTCSRPHIFLQRNLRRCIQKPSRKMERKRKKRKRGTNNTQHSSVAKKQHFQIPDQNIGGYDNCADSSFCSGFGLADCSSQSVDHEAALDLTEEMLSPVSPKTSSVMGKQGAEKKEPKTKTCFRDLLTKCLCNSSVIVHERR